MKLRRSIWLYLTVMFAAALLAGCAESFSADEAPSGWKKYEGTGFSIYLPETYRGGTEAPDMAAAAEQIRQAGNSDLAIAMESSAYLLYALDSAHDYTTSVNILAERNSVVREMSIEEYVDLSLANLANVAGYSVIGSEAISVPGFEAWELTANIDAALLAGSSGTFKLVQYLLKNEDTVWILSFGSLNATFAQNQIVFEQSMFSFKEQ